MTNFEKIIYIMALHFQYEKYMDIIIWVYYNNT